MKDFFTRQYRHLLWKDELGDPFLLLKYGEVFQYSENVFRIHAWNKKTFSRLKKFVSIFNEWGTDDGLLVFDVNKADLPQIIEAWAPRRRFNRKSGWLKDKELRLAHMIIPYRPGVCN